MRGPTYCIPSLYVDVVVTRLFGGGGRRWEKDTRVIYLSDSDLAVPHRAKQ